MRNTIAIMNTKGGVGKSTIVLAAAETLAAFHGKNVLVIDSDSQASVSAMLMSTTSLRKLQAEGRTIVDYLVSVVLRNAPVEWTDFVVGGVSDIDDAKSVYLIPSDMQLTLFEREVSKESQHAALRAAISGLLSRSRIVFDVVLIDCPPGLSVLTESWLREADFHISPTKPDYISVCGLDVFRRFKSLNPEMGFAENMGVVINMKDRTSPADDEYHRWLAENPENRCFMQVLPRLNALQHASRYHSEDRSFAAKYPGEIGHAIRGLVDEILSRLDEANRGLGGATGSTSANVTPTAQTVQPVQVQPTQTQPNQSQVVHAQSVQAQPSRSPSIPAQVVQGHVVPAQAAKAAPPKPDVPTPAAAPSTSPAPRPVAPPPPPRAAVQGNAPPPVPPRPAPPAPPPPAKAARADTTDA